jgi:hypothetical protein
MTSGQKVEEFLRREGGGGVKLGAICGQDCSYKGVQQKNFDKNIGDYGG